MARDFDGSADYLYRNAAQVASYPLSFACLVRVDSLSTSPFFFQYGNSADAGVRLGLYFTTGGKLGASVRNVTPFSRTWETTATVSTGTWYSAVGVFASSTSVVAYLNGVSTGSYTHADTTTIPTFDRVAVGALVRSTVSNYLDGQIAEAASWNIALTQAEAEMLASGHSPLFVRPQSLVTYWPLHGRSGAAGGEEDWVNVATLSQNSSPALADHPRIIYPRRRTQIIAPAAATVPTLTSITSSLVTTTGARLTVAA